MLLAASSLVCPMCSARSTGCISPLGIRFASAWRTRLPSYFESASRPSLSFEAAEMGTITQSLSASTWTSRWLWDFLKEELAPYPGRVSLVVRMVTASTLVVIIGMTFRIPYTAFAALFALVLSRESIEATANAARALVMGVVLGAAYVVFGALFALGDPMLRFLWVGGSLFLAFYTLSALSNYAAVARFAYLIVITIPLWDTQDSAESKVESTLWAVGAITIGSVITFVIELVFASFKRTDELSEAIMERLVAVEELMED